MTVDGNEMNSILANLENDTPNSSKSSKSNISSKLKPLRSQNKSTMKSPSKSLSKSASKLDSSQNAVMNRLSSNKKSTEKSHNKNHEGFGISPDSYIHDLTDTSMLSNTSNKRRQTIDAHEIDDLIDSSLSSRRISTSSKRSRKSLSSTKSVSNFNEDFSISSNKKNERRETIDAAILNDIMGDLDESRVNIESENDKPNFSPLSIASSVGNTNDISNISRRESFASLISIGDIAMEQNRRLTADPEDIDNILDNLDSSVENFESHNRRVTADPTDMASLIAGLCDDDTKAITSDNRRYTADPAAIESLLAGMNDDEDINNQSVNQRRETVDPNAMESLLNGLDESFGTENHPNRRETVDADDLLELAKELASPKRDVTTNLSYDLDENATSLCGILNEIKSSPAPSKIEFNEPKGSILKSCLSTKKAPISSIRKSVIFGSPTAAEFNKQSPTTNITPMHKSQAKQYFPEHFSISKGATPKDEVHKFEIEENEDPITSENSKILDEWDRLTNSSIGSDEFSNEEEDLLLHNSNAKPKRNSTGSLNSKKSHRRKSLTKSSTAVAVLSAEKSTLSGTSEEDDSQLSHTVNLTGNLLNLMSEADKEMQAIQGDIDVDISFNSTTKELEPNLQSLMRHIDYTHHSISYDSELSNETSGLVHSNDTSMQSEKSVASKSSGTSTQSFQSKVSSEYRLGPLIGIDSCTNAQITVEQPNILDLSLNSKDISFSYVADEESNTVQLEGKLGDLLTSYEAQAEETDHNNISSILSTSVNDEVDQVDEAVELDSADTMNISRDMSILNDEVVEETTEETNEVIVSTSVDSHDMDTAAEETSKANDIIVDVNEDSSLHKGNAISLLNRLKHLNAGARENTLIQCSTSNAPIVSSRLSVGFGRRSTFNPSRKSIMPRPIQPIQSTRQSIAPIAIVKEIIVENEIETDNSIEIEQQEIMDVIEEEAVQEIQEVEIQTVEEGLNSSFNVFESLSNENEIVLKQYLRDIIVPYLEANKELDVTLLLDNITTSWTNGKSGFSFQVSEDNLLDLSSDILQAYTRDMKSHRSCLQNFIQYHNDVTLGFNIVDETSLDMTYLKKYQDLMKEEDELRKICAILNKFTYCQVKEYSTKAIEIEVIFTLKFRTLLKFELQPHDESNSSSMLTSNMSVEIVELKDDGKMSNSDCLAYAFFAQIIANDELRGPLSSAELSKVEYVHEIPKILRKVSFILLYQYS